MHNMPQVYTLIFRAMRDQATMSYYIISAYAIGTHDDVIGVARHRNQLASYTHAMVIDASPRLEECILLCCIH